jgi:hypothetical protein
VKPEAQSQLQIHSAHIALFLVWLVIFAAVYVRDRLGRARVDEPGRGARPSRAYLVVIALTSVVAGAVHLTIIRQHFQESVLYGGFFLALTIVQFGFAAWVVWRPTPALLRAGALASVAVVLLWLATRTTGIPVGPGAGDVEPFGVPDAIASGAELVTALLCLPALYRWRRQDARSAGDVAPSPVSPSSATI